jgi:PKD repeat protein
MKIKLTLLILVATISGSSFAQSYAVVSGHVTNTSNGAPIPNQMVYFYTDSSSYGGSTPSGFSYSGGVYTNSGGFYTDTIPLTDSSATYTQGAVAVYTYDCNGNFSLDTVFFSVGHYNLTANFTVCRGCSGATFNSVADSTNALLYNFSASSSDTLTSWTWSFGDSTTASGATPSHTFAYGGWHTVCLHYTTSFGCSDSTCNSVFVGTYVVTVDDPGCDANFGISQVSSNFNFTDYSFANTDNVDAIVNWKWNFGDGTTSTVQSPSHNYSVSGAYHVVLTIFTAEGCSSTLDMPVNTDGNQAPNLQADFELSLSPNLPFTYNFSDASTSGSDPISTYLFNFGDGTTSNLTTPVHTYSTPGVYQIVHTITTYGGLTSVYTENLVVDSVCSMYLVATSIVNQTTNGASNGAININVIGTAPFSYTWSNNATTQNISGLAAGYYNVWVTDASGCQTWGTFDILTQSDSSTWSYTDSLHTDPIDTCFNFLPASAEIYNYAFNQDSTISITWAVFDSTGTLHGYVTTTYGYNVSYNGYYTVLLEINCDSTRSIHSSRDFWGHIYIRGLSTGINKLDAKNNMIVYPNPVSDKLNVSFALPQAEQVKIVILNSIGQVIRTESVNYISGQKTIEINTAPLAQGVYFVNLNYNGQSANCRFVK